MLNAGRMLGLKEATARRELDCMVLGIAPEADKLIAAITAGNAQLPEAVRAVPGGEMRMLRAIRHIIIEEMVKKLKP